MAQHSHSVYGNVPFQYQKNGGASQRYTHNLGGRSNANNPNPNYNNFGKSNELLGKKGMFKSTEVLNRSGRLPFSDRNGKLHRSNPHLFFSGLKLSEPNCKPNPSKTTSKWKSEISHAANLVNRKWCDFVFRRNTDNKLYRSESFRFIQKTSSLQLLPPLSAGLNKYRSKKFQVPVSDDYVEPLDQVLGRHKAAQSPQDSSPQSSTNKSTSNKAGLISDNEDQHDDVDADSTEYNEIIEPYNAPYYYSDTIKQEPTYCSPCSTWNHHNCVGENKTQNQNEHIADQVPPLTPLTTLSSLQPSQNPHTRQNYRVVVVGGGGHISLPQTETSPTTPTISQVEERMARKRYETAFLPSSSAHTSQPSSPDVDSLLLAIESSCSLAEGGRSQNNSHEDNNVFFGEGKERGRGGHTQEEDRSWKRDKDSQLASMSYCQSSHHHLQSHYPGHITSVVNSGNGGGGGSITATSSPLADKKSKSKPNMPLSEPLPQKKYSNNNNSSSSSSPSTSFTSTSCRPSDKRLLLTMMKDNSVSSLESIDSTKSEDLHPFSRPYGDATHHHHHRGVSGGGFYFGRGSNCKLLSPISDKSPLEPISLQQPTSGGVGEPHYNQSISHYHRHNEQKPWSGSHHHYHQINTAELINVPWDMPKIRRRLALLADSGISLDCSLDCPGNAQSESGGQFFTSDEQKSFDDSNLQYTSRTHIRGNSDLRVTGDSVDNSSSKPCYSGESGRGSSTGKSGRLHNLQLNLDNGMVQDEYYEDPRLNFTEPLPQQVQPHPKPRLPWVTNVTSVQVHNSSSGSNEGTHHHPPPPPPKPDRCRMTLDFGAIRTNTSNRYDIDPSIELEAQEWFHGAITRSEAEAILRATKEGSFLVRNCESSSFNRYSLSLKSARGYIHVRIEPNSLGSFSLGEQEFPSVPHLVLHFMCHRLPIKGAEHVKLLYPVITQLL